MIRFSELSCNNILGKLLRFCLLLVPKSAIIPIMQGPCKGLKWVAGSGVHGMWLGSYEADIQNFINKCDIAGKIAFDIGANVGFYSILFSRMVGSNGRVISFEPFPRNVSYLKKHIQINKINNVEIHACAIGKINCTMKFDTRNHHAQGRIGQVGELEVNVCTLDSLEIPNMSVGIMKIDVEGAEADVLHGGRLFFKKHRPVILLSTHGEKEVSECKDFFEEYEYAMIPSEENEKCSEWVVKPKEVI